MKRFEALPYDKMGDVVPLGARIYNLMRMYEMNGDGYLDDAHDNKPAKDSFYVVVQTYGSQRTFGYCAAGFERIGEAFGVTAAEVSVAIRNYAVRNGWFVKVSLPGVKKRRWMTVEQASYLAEYLSESDLLTVCATVTRAGEFNKKHGVSFDIAAPILRPATQNIAKIASSDAKIDLDFASSDAKINAFCVG